MEQGPTEPHAGRSTFLLSSGGAGGWVLLSGLWYGADCYCESVCLPDASGMSGLQWPDLGALNPNAVGPRSSRNDGMCTVRIEWSTVLPAVVFVLSVGA